MNKNELKQFLNICKMSEESVKMYLKGKLHKYYETVIDEDGFLYAKGNYPVLLTAHMDTVHTQLVSEVAMTTETYTGKEQHIISSPQGIGGDDRCGIFMILSILQNGNKDKKPSVLFCEQEEKGGIGSDKFTLTKYIDDLKEMKYLIELDRANANDLVFYDDVNYDFHDFCEKTTGFREAFGSFTDICNLSPVCGVSSVNISCGYYHQHTLKEFVVLEEMEDAIKATKKLIDAAENVEQFEFVEYKPKGNKYNYGYYNYDYDYDYDNYGYSYSGKRYYSSSGKDDIELFVNYLYNGNEEEVRIVGKTEEECWMKFFMEYSEVCFNDVLDFYCD